jgi:exopolyphosphatase / guanosine-5'-triphosphate,3'-diphosphate pyrophosphatase
VQRLAAVDIGSNTVHVLVADAEGGSLTDVAHHSEMIELGAVVDETGRIGHLHRQRTLRALGRVMRQAESRGFEVLVAGATEAVRQAADGERLLADASQALGVQMRLISRRREAQLSFLGVASVHAGKREWLMVDLGGGSSEVVAAEADRMAAWASIPVGSGAFAARYLSDPPRPGDRQRLRAAAVPLLNGLPESDAERLVVTGGTAAHLVTVVSRDSPPMLLSAQALLLAEERLDAAPAAEIGAHLDLETARVRSLRGGVEILLLLLDYYGLHSLHVSFEGLRQGMLLAWLRKRDRWWVEDR